MSIQYCKNCCTHIDTDYNAEHFEVCKEEKQTIKRKTLFNKWHDVSYEEALSFAKWLLGRITTGVNNEERLKLVNSRFKGIRFTLKDLVGEDLS